MEKQMDGLSCGELVRLFLKGTYNAFGVLYGRYCNFIRNSCLKRVKNEAIADELMQDAFFRTAGTLHNFRPKEGEKSFRKLVWTIAIHALIDYIRHQKNEKEAIKIAFELGNINTPKEPNPCKVAQEDEQKEILLKAVNELPELPRVCVISFFLDGLPLKDICGIYNLTRNQYYHQVDIGKRVLAGKFKRLL